jgi:hypothetical protein
VTLNINEESGSNPVITDAVHTSLPNSLAGTPLSKAMKFRTESGSDWCTMMFAFPGNNVVEPVGMFNGMLWKDFITARGERQRHMTL